MTALGCAVLALGVAGCSRRAEAPGAAAQPFRITVQLDWVAEPEHGGLYQALAKGFFREAGLDVELVQGGANAFVMQKLATDKADIGQTDSTNTLVAIAQGLPVIMVGAVFQNDPTVLMLHADSPVKSFGDLNGKTIMARPEWAFIPYLKRKYHIEFNTIPQNFEVANFISNPDFIQQGYFTAEPYYIVRGGGKYPKFLFEWDAGFDAYATLVANRPWAARNAGRLHAFMAAYIRGWRDYLEGDPSPGNELMKRVNPNANDDFMKFCRDMIIKEKLVTGRGATDDSMVGRITRERLALQIRQLEELGILPKGRLNVDQVMTTEYLP
jgi:NitT/TauT family transport system substrate-binding protein